MAGQTTHGREHSRPVKPTSEGQDSIFFKLPPEIRLMIYEELLLCTKGFLSDGEFRPSDKIGPHDRGLVRLDHSHIYGLHNGPLTPAILRTCKHIYREAIHVLYSKNIFQCREPSQMSDLMNQMGPDNVKMIHSFVVRPRVTHHDVESSLFRPMSGDIGIPFFTKVNQWVLLFGRLAQEASGLRYMRVDWWSSGLSLLQRDIEPEVHVSKNTMGRSLAFGLGLARIKGLRKLSLEGYYGERWPRFFRQTMNVQVDVSYAAERILALDLHDATKNDLRWARREMKAINARLAWYQEDSEYLWP